MQESFGCIYLAADAGESRLSIRQQMQEDMYLFQETIRQRMQESLSDSGISGAGADAGVSLLDSGCRSLSIRQRTQETLYQTADAEDSLSDRGCRRHSISSGCRRLSIRQRMQETLYQTADACLIECLLHPLSDGETPASAV